MKEKIDLKISRGNQGGASSSNPGKSSSTVINRGKKKTNTANHTVKRKKSKTRNGAGISLGSLPNLWQVDFIGILLTVIGIIAVLGNLEQIEAAIVYFICNLLSLTGYIALIGVVVLGIYLMLFGRRRRW